MTKSIYYEKIYLNLKEAEKDLSLFKSTAL